MTTSSTNLSHSKRYFHTFNFVTPRSRSSTLRVTIYSYKVSVLWTFLTFDTLRTSNDDFTLEDYHTYGKGEINKQNRDDILTSSIVNRGNIRHKLSVTHSHQ